MNIFVLNRDPQIAAREHCDQHVRKMILEYAQMLSTAHRLLDGTMVTIKVNNRPKRLWLLHGELAVVVKELVDGPDGPLELERARIIGGLGHYLVAHAHHPCTVWARSSTENYGWLYHLFSALCAEFEVRSEKKHVTELKLLQVLAKAPKNLREGPLTPFAQAMPEHFKVKDDAVAAYRNFYLGEKIEFATWSRRELPGWFAAGVDDPSKFRRKSAVDQSTPTGA